ncbi:MAG: carbohydrate ABC transporter permease [Candidatus Nanopelagicales bacterium]
MNRSRSKARLGLFGIVVLTLAIAWVLIPLAYLLSMSLMSRTEVISGSYLPTTPQWENWQAVVEAGIPTNIRNSLVVALAAALITLALATPAAWAIARRGVGGRLLSSTLLAPWLLPPIVALVPIFLLLRVAGLNNTLLGLTLVYSLVNVPVAVWLLEGFVRKIPVEIEESATVEGAGDLRLLLRIVIPLIAPGLVAVGIIIGVLNYNEYLLASFITQKPELQTLPVAISLYQGDRFAHLGRIAAASIIGVIPLYVVAVLSQRWLVSGLTSGGVK